MYHYQFQKIICMQLEMMYAIFIIGTIRRPVVAILDM